MCADLTEVGIQLSAAINLIKRLVVKEVQFDLLDRHRWTAPRNDEGGRPYVARNASLNRRTLRNPAAKAMSDKPIVA
jgi:hypothetical protein